MWESVPSRQCVCLIYEAHVMGTKGYVFPLKECANYLKEQGTPPCSHKFEAMQASNRHGLRYRCTPTNQECESAVNMYRSDSFGIIYGHTRQTLGSCSSQF